MGNNAQRCMVDTLASKTYRLNLEKNKTSFLTWIE
jgi:hypothetical protein